MWCAFVHIALLVVLAFPSFAQMEQVIAHPWMKGTSGWSGDVTAPMQDAVEVSMGGGGGGGGGEGEGDERGEGITSGERGG